MAGKRKRRQGRAQLKVRLPEALRRQIEFTALKNGHSMNTEIVNRLKLSAQSDPTRLAAQALVHGLDQAIVREMLNELFQEDVTRMKAADLSDLATGEKLSAIIQRMAGDSDKEPELPMPRHQPHKIGGKS